MCGGEESGNGNLRRAENCKKCAAGEGGEGRGGMIRDSGGRRGTHGGAGRGEWGNAHAQRAGRGGAESGEVREHSASRGVARRIGTRSG